MRDMENKPERTWGGGSPQGTAMTGNVELRRWELLHGAGGRGCGVGGFVSDSVPLCKAELHPHSPGIAFHVPASSLSSKCLHLI